MQPLLLVDSWSAFKDTDGMERNIPVGHEFIPKLIPEGTTPLVQTLDVYGFRIIKAFMRRFTDWIVMYSVDVQIYQRNSVIRLVSLTYKQYQFLKGFRTSYVARQFEFMGSETE